MSIARNIRELREKHGMTQQQFGEIAGVSDKAVSTWETGQNTPRMGAIQKIADYFKLPKSAILDDEEAPTFNKPNYVFLPETKHIPIRGEIACGQPIMAIDEVEAHAEIPLAMRADFSLRCRGDSMIGIHIIDGDLAHIRAQEDVENGQVAAVEVDGEATLKRVKKVYNSAGNVVAIELHAENPSMAARRYDGGEMARIRIDGLLVGVTRDVGQ